MPRVWCGGVAASALLLAAGTAAPQRAINKELTSPPSPLPAVARYDDGQSSGEDSVAVWVAPSPDDSLLFVTHKTGNRVDYWRLGTNQRLGSLSGFNAPNGVAVDELAGILYVTDRHNHAIKKYVVADILAGRLSPALTFGTGQSPTPQPMGITVLHQGAETFVYATYIGSSTRVIRAFRPDGTLVRNVPVGRIGLEMIRADSARGLLYVADEGRQLVKVYRPDGTHVRDFGATEFQSDVEGIDIYECGSDGYILVSDQYANEFEVFDRITYAPLGRFKVEGVAVTDGIVLVRHPLPHYPSGALFMQSRDRYVVGASWQVVSAATGMSICDN